MLFFFLVKEHAQQHFSDIIKSHFKALADVWTCHWLLVIWDSKCKSMQSIQYLLQIYLVWSVQCVKKNKLIGVKDLTKPSKNSIGKVKFPKTGVGDPLVVNGPVTPLWQHRVGQSKYGWALIDNIYLMGSVFRG